MLSKSKVLVLDDQQSMLTFLSAVLSSISPIPIVTTFTSPLAALSALAEEQFDLVLLDYEMPEMNGDQFIARARTYPGYEHVPLVVVTIVEDREIRLRSLQAGATDFLNKPIDANECKARCINLLTMRHNALELSRRATQATQFLTDQIQSQSVELERVQRGALMWAAALVEQHSKTERAHIVRISQYASAIAKALGFSTSDVAALLAASTTHDIGNITLERSLLTKIGLKTADEVTLLRSHTAAGHDILKLFDSPYAELAATIALHHHERYDGSGYPFGLSGRNIPLAARIVAVADAFDDLTFGTGTKGHSSIDIALANLQDARGTLFDHECVDAFLASRQLIQNVILTLGDSSALPVSHRKAV